VHKYRIVALLLHQLRNSEQLADDAIELEFDSEFGKSVDLDIDRIVGKTEFRDTVFEHAARDMQRS